MEGKITKLWTLRTMSQDSLSLSLSILPIGRKDWYNQFMTSQNQIFFQVYNFVFNTISVYIIFSYAHLLSNVFYYRHLNDLLTLDSLCKSFFFFCSCIMCSCIYMINIITQVIPLKGKNISNSAMVNHHSQKSASNQIFKFVCNDASIY